MKISACGNGSSEEEAGGAIRWSDEKGAMTISESSMALRT